MRQKEEYRSRSAGVRADARSHLARLREERLTRRAAGGTEKHVDPVRDVAAPAPIPSVEPVAASASDEATAVGASVRVAPVPAEPAEAPVPETPEEPPVPAVMTRPATDLPVEATAQTDATVIDVVPATEPFKPKDSDLFTLPGAGRGLVLMLHAVDVDSLRALSNSDPVRLTNDLKLMGQILEISDWIAFARIKAG